MLLVCLVAGSLFWLSVWRAHVLDWDGRFQFCSTPFVYIRLRNCKMEFHSFNMDAGTATFTWAVRSSTSHNIRLGSS